MKKFLKLIPVLVVGLIAAFAAVACASTEKEEHAASSAATVMRTAVSCSAMDGACEHDYEATQVIAANCTEQG